MTSRPLPIAAPSQRDIDAGWSSIKGALEDKRAGTWSWAWIVACIALFVAVSAGATVLVREYQERVRRERERRAPVEKPRTVPSETPQQEQGASPAAPTGTGTGSLSPVVPAADEGARTGDDARGSRRSRDADTTKTGKGRAQGGRASGGASGYGGSTGGGSTGNTGSTSESRGYSPFAGMSPKSQANDSAAEPRRDTQQEPDDGVDAFAAGSAARAQGDFKTALAHYEKFVAKHPHDERAGIAAMEAARILADHLEQPAKALRWAEKAAQLADGSMREDARARVVQLLGTLKRTRCATAQRDFLRDYPNSVHAPRVQRACGETP